MPLHMDGQIDVGELARGMNLTAASVIVTIYGDVVVPRGGVLWTGSLIGICARLGLSENLVRTATSRLVAAGRLEGERIGRRSFYRLAEAAQEEFATAARLLYARQMAPQRWHVLHAPGIGDDLVRRYRMGRMGGDVWLCPDRGEGVPPAALVLAAELPAEAGGLAGFWDLDGIGARYRSILERFAPLAEALATGRNIGGGEALAARLLLVHAYRHVLLRDPGLPEAALPADWAGGPARALFRDLYLALSQAADRSIAAELEGAGEPLPLSGPEVAARLAALA